MRIAHVITRLIVGGAQENTILCCQDLIEDYGDDVLLVTGPPLGPEEEPAGRCGKTSHSEYHDSVPAAEYQSLS